MTKTPRIIKKEVEKEIKTNQVSIIKIIMLTVIVRVFHWEKIKIAVKMII